MQACVWQCEGGNESLAKRAHLVIGGVVDLVVHLVIDLVVHLVVDLQRSIARSSALGGPAKYKLA